MGHHDHRAVDHHVGEGDDAVGGGHDRRALRAGQVDAPVAREPRCRGRVEVREEQARRDEPRPVEGGWRGRAERQDVPCGRAVRHGSHVLRACHSGPAGRAGHGSRVLRGSRLGCSGVSQRDGGRGHWEHVDRWGRRQHSERCERCERCGRWEHSQHREHSQCRDHGPAQGREHPRDRDGRRAEAALGLEHSGIVADDGGGLLPGCSCLWTPVGDGWTSTGWMSGRLIDATAVFVLPAGSRRGPGRRFVRTCTEVRRTAQARTDDRLHAPDRPAAPVDGRGRGPG